MKDKFGYLINSRRKF